MSQKIHNEAVSSLLKPKTMKGEGMEYTLTQQCLVITSAYEMDSTKRKIEIPWESLGRFLSELQEIEKLAQYVNI